MKINGKEITLGKKTMWIHMQRQKILFADAKIKDWQPDIWLSNTLDANMYLVSALTGVKQETIENEREPDEFDAVLQMINDRENKEKKE